MLLSIPYRTTTARDYKMAACVSGLVFVLAPFLLRKNDLNLIIVLVLGGTGFAGSLVGYLRTRKESVEWTECRSHSSTTTAS